MQRTLISISPEDRLWLEKQARHNNLSLAGVIRKAIACFREFIGQEGQVDVLKKTAGLWKARRIDGLEYQNKLRKEW